MASKSNIDVFYRAAELFKLPAVQCNWVAEQVGVSARKLETAFQNIQGITPQEFQTKLIIERVQALLRDSDLSNQEIAVLEGYSDAPYLSYMHKQNTGETLNEYRKRHGNYRRGALDARRERFKYAKAILAQPCQRISDVLSAAEYNSKEALFDDFKFFGEVVSPWDYHLRHMMLRVEEQLIDGVAPREIAADELYDNPASLNSLFKRWYGVTMGDYADFDDCDRVAVQAKSKTHLLQIEPDSPTNGLV